MTLPTATISERSSSTKPPSTHVKALITWVAIFPLVTLSAYALAPFASEWNPLLRSFVVSLIVVPAAVYIVVPQLMRSYTKIRGTRTKDSNNSAQI